LSIAKGAEGQLYAMLAALFAANVLLIPLSAAPEASLIVLPAVSIMNITALLFLAMWSSDGSVPLEIGTIYAVAVALYGLAPLAGFLLSGMEFSLLSDTRLVQYAPSPEEVGAFAWKYVIYLGSFSLAYLFTRWSGGVRPQEVGESRTVLPFPLFLVLFLLVLYFFFLRILFGVSYAWSYEDTAAAMDALLALPLVVHQVSSHLNGMLFTAKVAIMILVFERYWRRPWTFVLVAWLTLEVALSVLKMGARTEAVLLLLGAMFLYHWRIKPLKLSVLAAGGVFLIAGYIAFGVVRDYREAFLEADEGRVSSSNEFQAVFSTAFDLEKRRLDGSLQVPWSVYLSDITAVVPSQFVPFEKVDKAEWYLDVAGVRDTGVGFAFGAISESVIGFGNIELLLRGMVIGYLFARLHLWYRRHPRDFWVLLVYCMATLWSYHTFRNASFHLLVLFQYQVLPVILFTEVYEYLERQARELGGPLVAGGGAR